MQPNQVYKTIGKASYKCIGTQNAQLQYLHQLFVRQKNWVTNSQFLQIKNLCQTLPGPTVIQIVVSLTMLVSKSPMAGLISFFIFSIPSVLVLSILGWLASKYANNDTIFPTQIKLLLLGFLASATGIMISSFINNFRQHMYSPAKVIIMITTAFIFLVWRTVSSITFCLLAGAIISLYMQIQTKKKMSSKSQILLRDSKLGWIFGKNALLILFVLYIILWTYFQFYPQSQYMYTFIFYFVGCYLIGPLSTIFAHFYVNFLQLNLVDSSQFWIGVPFAFMLPGSIINVSIYYGSLIDGLTGTILSTCFLYLPCFLALCGILPQWRYYRDKPGIQRLTIGITCVANGLCLGVIVLALQHIVPIDTSLSLCIVIISLFSIRCWRIYPFIIILLGGLLANMRRWGLIYYRLIPDPY